LTATTTDWSEIVELIAMFPRLSGRLGPNLHSSGAGLTLSHADYTSRKIGLGPA
jgi:hypothetical protein